jgi:hypothetical protein
MKDGRKGTTNDTPCYQKKGHEIKKDETTDRTEH